MTTEFFAKLPAKLAKDGHLIKIGAGLPVYVYLTIIADWKTKIVKVKVKTICNAIGKGDRTVRGWLKDLEKGGYIAARPSDHYLKITVLELPKGIADRQKIADLTRQKIADPARQKIAGRPAENCRPPYMKFLRESFPRPFGDENQRRKHPNPTTNRFFYFALKTFERFNGYPLHCDETDVEKLDNYFNQGDRSPNHFKMFRVAWLLYQTDTENNYLKTVPRTINLFLKQNTLNDFFRKAAALLKKTEQQRMKKGRAPNTPAAILNNQEVNPDPIGQKYWNRCLDWLEKKLEPANYKYFAVTTCVGFSPELITLAVPNNLYKKILQEHFQETIWQAMNGVGFSNIKFKFVVASEEILTQNF